MREIGIVMMIDSQKDIEIGIKKDLGTEMIKLDKSIEKDRRIGREREKSKEINRDRSRDRRIDRNRRKEKKIERGKGKGKETGNKDRRINHGRKIGIVTKIETNRNKDPQSNNWRLKRIWRREEVKAGIEVRRRKGKNPDLNPKGTRNPKSKKDRMKDHEAETRKRRRKSTKMTMINVNREEILHLQITKMKDMCLMIQNKSKNLPK